MDPYRTHCDAMVSVVNHSWVRMCMCSCHGSWRWCIQNLDVVGFDLRWAKRKVEQRQIIQWDLGLESTSTMESLIMPCVQKNLQLELAGCRFIEFFLAALRRVEEEKEEEGSHLTWKETYVVWRQWRCGKCAGSQHFRKAQTRTSQPEVKHFSPNAAR